ncbi:MAG: hypothetical protein K0S47_4365 [Herbinix sp.]|jgi:hypothetical protein|nr:hypothetical protein [Herbinix sp.]
MIDKKLFIHPLEESLLEELKNNTYFSEEIIDNYKNYDEKMRRPDLFGKTVRVTMKQFPTVYKNACEVADILEMELPEIFVYEDFYYGVESKGVSKPWIEISAKTIFDFNENELRFLIAREMFNIHMGHTYYDVLIDETLGVIQNGLRVMPTDVIVQSLKYSMYKWRRISNYSADCFGYVICNDVRASIYCILKMILNNHELANNICLLDYIKQAETINEMNSPVESSTKLDEQMPYGPFRVKNIIAYASSNRGQQALKELDNEKG